MTVTHAPRDNGLPLAEVWLEAVAKLPNCRALRRMKHWQLREQARVFLSSLAATLEDESAYLPPEHLPYVASLVESRLANEALRGELRRREEQVRDLIAETLDAQEAALQHLSLELHDGVTQTLTSVLHPLKTLEDLSPPESQPWQLTRQVTTLVHQAIQECREVINGLQPAMLSSLGLVATLRQEMQQLGQEAGWKVDCKADYTSLPLEVETGLYRIVHEALTNARRHADTQQVAVCISHTRSQVTVEVRDWGRGFDAEGENLAPGGRGMGLFSMRKRAQLLGGSCTISSSLGRGTTVRVTVPLA